MQADGPDIEGGPPQDLPALAAARQALADSHAELRRLVAARDKVQEDERKRIARELHDDLQQSLAAIRIDLMALTQRLGPVPESVRRLLDETGELAAAALESTRRIINDLRPQILEDLGLFPALEVMAGRFARRTGVACEVEEHDARAEATALPPAVATCLYRVAQEALGNIGKHAAAQRVSIELHIDADGRIALAIEDDGTGMDTARPRAPDAFGLLGMKERVHALGAQLRVRSEHGAGTRIEVVVPAPSGGVR